MTTTCEVWMGKLQCGEPAVAKWVSLNARTTTAAEIQVCAYHGLRMGQLFSVGGIRGPGDE